MATQPITFAKEDVLASPPPSLQSSSSLKELIIARRKSHDLNSPAGGLEHKLPSSGSDSKKDPPKPPALSEVPEEADDVASFPFTFSVFLPKGGKVICNISQPCSVQQLISAVV